jgi:predicted transcriptional regulator
MVQREAEKKHSDIFEFVELSKIAKGINMNVGQQSFHDYMEELKDRNVFLYKGAKQYQLVDKGFASL